MLIKQIDMENYMSVKGDLLIYMYARILGSMLA